MSELRLKSTGTIKLFENDNTSNVTIASPASLGADRTLTLPDADVTLASGTMLATDGSGASLTALNASELGSGTVPTARLGSGTASSSTVLYGDQTYKAEPTGVALTGSTDNTVVTVTGADAIAGETSMTYDGTTLALTTSGGGLKLDALNSSDVNTLDDYEEGTSGTLTAVCHTSGTVTLNSGYDVVTYVKVGRLVHIQGNISVDAVSSPTGPFSIQGLPFSIAAGVTNYCSFTANGNSTNSLPENGALIPFVEPSSSIFYIVCTGDTDQTTGSQYMKAGTNFRFGGTYMASS